ncbi:MULTISPECIES: hypothetical protein [unclassified Shewanella]|uniref:hypothetical protein n=1 Tax=unclassified Shewanella TaxID=196818 RepID=UPI000CB072CA|nr:MULTISPECIES: hypothetical protein [unclassified Shewanella]PKH55863.1 hypothetical protein CXF84_16350 [Shewanella sp. Bg11-22]
MFSTLLQVATILFDNSLRGQTVALNDFNLSVFNAISGIIGKKKRCINTAPKESAISTAFDIMTQGYEHKTFFS